MTRQTDDILFEIGVLADNAKNILAMAEQSQEADELSASMRSCLWVGIDYLHKIVKMAESAEKDEALE